MLCASIGRVILKTIKHRIELPDWKTPLIIRPIYDIHIGHSAVDYKKFTKDCFDVANTDYMFWIGGGDYIEAFNRSYSKYDPCYEADFCRNEPDIIATQLDYFYDNITPMKSRCLGILEGNHENNMLKHSSRDFIKDMRRVIPGTDALHIGYQGFIELSIHISGKARMKLVIFVHHGSGGTGRMQGSMTNALERIWMFNDCDIALMGHNHRRHYIRTIRNKPFGNKVKKVMGGAAFCGTYKEHPEQNGSLSRSWEAKKDFPPNLPLGYTIEVWPQYNGIRFIEDLYINK